MAGRDLLNVFKYLKGEFKEDRSRLSSIMPGDRKSEHKLKHRMFHVNTVHFFLLVNLFFTVGVTEQWDRLPLDIVESPFLKNKKRHFGHGPGHPALVGPSLAGQPYQMTSRAPFQNQLSSDSITVICQLHC